MSSKEKLDLVNDAKKLADRQNAEPDKEVLPKLELNDVPKSISFPKTKNLQHLDTAQRFMSNLQMASLIILYPKI